MPRREERGEPPALALHRVAIREALVGAERVVAAFPALLGRGRVRAVSQRRRAGRPLQRGGTRRVVAVRVADDDLLDPLAFRGAKDRRQVRRVLRTGVEHRDGVAAADQVGVRAAVGERPGVVAHDPAHQRREPLGLAVGRSVLSQQRQVHVRRPLPISPRRIARPASTINPAPRSVVQRCGSWNTSQPISAAKMTPV